MSFELVNVSSNVSTAIDCKDVQAPTELSFLTFSLSIVFFFVVVTGNVLVILAIAKDPYKDLRKKPFILLVGNLACADLIVGLIVTPISIVLHFMEGLGESILHISWVKLLHLAYFISCTASLLSMAVITIDRHIAIAYPLRYKSSAISRRPKQIFAFIWAIAIGLPFVYFKVGYVRYAFVFGNIAICVAVIFLSSCVYALRRIAVSPNTLGTRSRRSEKAEKHVTKVFSFVLIAYLFCYLPSCLIIYVMNFCSSCNCEVIHWLRDMQFVFVLLNSCLNPILYSWQMKTFKNAFKALLCGSFKPANLNSVISSPFPSSISKEPNAFKREKPNAEVEEGFPQNGDTNCIELNELSINSLSMKSRKENAKRYSPSFEQKIEMEDET